MRIISKKAIKDYFENWNKAEEYWEKIYGEDFDYLCR